MTVMGLPMSFRFITGLFVDAKVVPKRKYILVFFSIMATII